jgi:hypothetical protein
VSSGLSALLREELEVVNIGLALFGEALTEQGVAVVQVDWRPPAGGDLELLRLLDGLNQGNGRSR